MTNDVLNRDGGHCVVRFTVLPEIRLGHGPTIHLERGKPSGRIAEGLAKLPNEQVNTRELPEPPPCHGPPQKIFGAITRLTTYGATRALHELRSIPDSNRGLRTESAKAAATPQARSQNMV